MTTELIVALDVDTLAKEKDLLARLKDTVTFYKVGLELFTAHGKRAVDLVHQAGARVFLDLKLHDIPRTVSAAVREAQKLGVEAVSLHLLGGAEMIRAAAEVSPRPKIWGVSVLTSMADKDVKAIHPKASLAGLLKSLAKTGWECGADALICSVQDVEQLRRALKYPDLRFVTPGIRPASADPGDQKRVATPETAARLGVDAVVVGRPVVAAPDPLRAAQGILGAMKRAAEHEVPKGPRLKLS
ncbi:MAG TPA: orotidine-5'-phosphate decarboxylase [Elusimicrobiota bacterium]|nr:orotidine-5'-phosphate decarboxylase [Elusimicrobiota bacterium]